MEKLGLSGDTIVVADGYVLKVCETNQQRFIQNVYKQKNFNNPYIQAVPVLETGLTSDNKNYVKMPFLKCGNPITWLSKTTTENFYNLESKILSYFEDCWDKSCQQPFDQLAWSSKIVDLKTKIQDDSLKNILSKLESLVFTQPFYYGAYHGDLTFSNLLISNVGSRISIDAIDFLDSFIHSPINDLVKMRQDTNHFWTINLIQDFGHIDTNRVVVLLNHLDFQIDQMIKNNRILNEYYLPFQILNLMRIIPYNTEPRIFAYLKKEIERLFHEFNSNHALCR